METSHTVKDEGKACSNKVEEHNNEILDDGNDLEDGSVRTGDEQWVVYMKQKLKPIIKERPDRRWEHSIFQVPEWIKNTTNKEAYRPWLVSLGPYHYSTSYRLWPMEEHKGRALWAVAKRMKRRDALNQLASVVDELADFLERAYDGLDKLWSEVISSPIIRRNVFKRLMLTDGCFLLEIFRVFGLLKKGVECDSYGSDDPVFSRRGFGYLYLALKSDVLVLENQLPLLLLQRLHEKIIGQRLEDKKVNEMVLDFLGWTYNGSIERLGHHPLELFHLSFCGDQMHQVHNKEWGDWDGSKLSVTELTEAGIQFKCSTGRVHAISFETGVLHMPEIEVNDRTEKEFLNLMAFERLYGRAGSNATAFMIFMDDIIDSEKDVALLRSKGVIKNMLSSDEEAAKLFNTLGKGALLNPSSYLYSVRHEINMHCKNKWNIWQANFRQTYLRNPWVFSAFVASGFLLIATILQTVYTVMSFYSS